MSLFNKIIIFIMFLSVTTLEANSFNNLSSITWNWIVIAVLSILFFIVLLSIIRDIKKTKKHINNIFDNQQNENFTKNSYLSDINSDRTLATNDLKESIKNLSVSTISDKEIFSKLSKDYKDIFLTNKEESIFLSIAKGNKIGKIECFLFDELLDELYEYNIIESKKYNQEKHIVVANKEILADIFLLLNKLQTKEHKFKKPKFKIDINSNRNNLTIIVDKRLKLNRTIKTLLEQNIKPIYDKKDKNYYGIYLYLLKYLTNMINATLKINVNDNSYMVTIDIPIDIKKNMLEKKAPALYLKEPKKALIVSESNTAQEVAKALNKLNIIADIKPLSELNKELPNFIEYDITFIYSKIFEPILTDYLRAIKTYSPLKIVAMVDSKNSLYPTKIVDKVVNLDKLEDELYSNVLELYKDEINNSSPKKQDREEIDGNRRYGKVLVADDDITNLHILEYMFKKYGIKAKTVTNGIDALKMLEKESFDMVILDSVMPKLDGYETVLKIRENNKFNSTPIIIHTSFSRDDSSMDKIFKLGFDSYLSKPFNKYDFKSLIERYMPVYSKPVKVTTPEKKSIKKEKEPLDTESLKEFIAIYGDSDKMLNRYIKEKREEQAFLLIDDLKDLAQKIDAQDFILLLDDIKLSIEEKQEIDSNLIYKLSNKLTELKKDIMKRLSA